MKNTINRNQFNLTFSSPLELNKLFSKGVQVLICRGQVIVVVLWKDSKKGFCFEIVWDDSEGVEVWLLCECIDIYNALCD